MKIGLITIHDTLNYGSLLQAVGLYKTLDFLGLDVELIDYKNEVISKKERIFSWREVRKVSDVVRHVLYYSKLKKKKENYWDFLRSNVVISKPYYRSTVKETNSIFDTFVVGSDIVWGTHITGHDYAYMLDFVDEDKLKVSCSSSVGSKWSDEEIPIVGEYLKRFHSISVREHQASEWIEEIIGKKVEVTCDPTMLIEPVEWKKYIRMNCVPSGDYVLVYMGNNKNNKHLLDGIAYGKKHNMPVYYMNFGFPVMGVRNIAPLHVSDWLALMANAHTVFTASYHGLLFPMYFNRNFFYYNTRGSNARIESLAKECHISYREGNEKNLREDKPISWDVVNNVFAEKRKFTIEYLINKLF